MFYTTPTITEEDESSTQPAFTLEDSPQQDSKKKLTKMSTCANISCCNEGTKQCSKCKTVKYCSRECQKEDWKVHKTICSTSVASNQLSLAAEEAIPKRKVAALAPKSEYHGALMLVSTVTLNKGETILLHGKSYLVRGLVQKTSATGYIENVLIFVESQGRFMFKGRIHRDIITLICGSEGLALLEKTKAISANAWITTGGDPSPKRKRYCESLLHENTGPVTKKDLEEYYRRFA